MEALNSLLCRMRALMSAKRGRGLMARRGWETHPVLMYVLAPLDQWAATRGYSRFAMFIDDLLLQCRARNYEVAIRQVNVAARSLARCIKHELKCQIATQKSQALASNQRHPKQASEDDPRGAHLETQPRHGKRG
eukprot:6895635-Pyramimonas_sp.AAC.1